LYRFDYNGAIEKISYPKNHTPLPPHLDTSSLGRLDNLPQIRCRRNVEIAVTMSPADENKANNGVAALLLGEREHTTTPSALVAEKFYISRGRSLKALAILSLGLVNKDGDPIFDAKTLPWSSAEKVSSIKPSAADMKEEVEQGASVDGIDPMPCPKAWTLQCLNDWLTAHPLVWEDDVSFVMSTIAARTTAAENAAREKQTKREL